MEQVSRPCDASRHCRQVPHNRGTVLEFLVLVFNLVNDKSIVMEQDGVLRVKTVLQVLSLEDCHELLEKSQ
jgi:hypothetical protein